MFLVKCEQRTESMSDNWWKEFSNEEELTHWMLYYKGHTIVHRIYHAKPITLRPITKNVKEVVGYEVDWSKL